ncbi:MAG: ABC transporter ATP-binding protein [Actinomycetales bacterium]|jgi:peptide/nickel transport system ATP-binding protein|nr:MAG: ABC transporter ATP-binding protein [Actinomycetales bacterium]
MSTVLKISHLEVDFEINGVITNTPLRGINLEIKAGKTLGIVGETGCGKTLTATAIMGLLPSSAIQRGEIEFGNHGDITKADMADIRGSEITMIFQNPQSAFNPIFSIGAQLTMVAQRRGISDIPATLTARLESVGLRDPKRVLESYPHELSGGMLQRAMIAMALLSSPTLLIADEPTTALDATIGDHVLTLIAALQKREGFAMLFISHDVTAVAKTSDEIAVIYAGRVVETGPTSEVMKSPQHPYTQGLLGAIPSAEKARGTLVAIPGNVPSVLTNIKGCAFADRCSLQMDKCAQEPPTVQIGKQSVACWAVNS